MATNQSDLIKAMTAASDAVIGAAVLTGLGAWAGIWIDGKLNSSPWFALVLSVTGMSLGLARMVAKAQQAEKKSSKNKDDGER